MQQQNNRHERDEEWRGSSRMREPSYEEDARRKADELIRQVEASKIQILQPAGNNRIHINHRGVSGSGHYRDDDGYESDEGDNANDGKLVRNLHQHHLVVIDEDYLVVRNFVEDHIRQRIKAGEYVDFSRLLPRDRTVSDEEGRMEIVNKNGRTYFVPATESEPGGISNFSRWEQTFRVFSNIYTWKFPGRAAELIQYNHIIHTAALTYTWDNIYLYDRDFHIHLGRYPHRSWFVILQQAWTMRLKDRNSNQSKGGTTVPTIKEKVRRISVGGTTVEDVPSEIAVNLITDVRFATSSDMVLISVERQTILIQGLIIQVTRETMDMGAAVVQVVVIQKTGMTIGIIIIIMRRTEKTQTKKGITHTIANDNFVKCINLTILKNW